MRKTAATVISILVFLALGQAVFAGDIFGTEPTPFAQDEAPDSFSSVIIYGLDANMGMGEIYFDFADGVPSLTSYAFDVETEGAGTIHVAREYSLIYSKSDYLAGESIFIMGSFSETSVTENGERFAAGRVSGQLMLFDSSAPDLSLIGKTLIMLAHYVESVEGVETPDGLSYYVLFFEPLDWNFGGPQSESASPEARATPTPNTGVGLFATPGYSDFHHTDEPYFGGSEEDHHSSGSSGSSSRSARHSSSSDMPEVSGPVQVAVGAIFVSVIAALSNLPSAAIGSGMGAFASSAGTAGSAGGGSASSSGAVGMSPVSGGTASSSGGGISDVLSAIGNFFKQLIANLRDMLTDEGRSYASGRISDLFEDDE